MESFIPIIVQLLSGVVGGNVAGAAMKNFSLGTIGNSVVGILGGGLGGQILRMFGIETGIGAEMGAVGGMDIEALLGSIAAGGVGGGTLLAFIGIVKKGIGA